MPTDSVATHMTEEQTTEQTAIDLGPTIPWRRVHTNAGPEMSTEEEQTTIGKPTMPMPRIHTNPGPEASTEVVFPTMPDPGVVTMTSAPIPDPGFLKDKLDTIIIVLFGIL